MKRRSIISILLLVVIVILLLIAGELFGDFNSKSMKRHAFASEPTAEQTACTEDSQCVAIGTSCLGWKAVNKAKAQEATDYLNRQTFKSCISTKQMGLGQPQVECLENHCVQR